MFHCGDLKLRNKVLCHAEPVSASLTKSIGNCPSPKEEGVGERVQLEEKINSSLKIVPFRKMLKDNFSQPYGTLSHKIQLSFTCSASVSLGESSSYAKWVLKNAFTLAEVLITLGIIGVVAAITLPNLMTAYKARVLRSQFMKSYSLVQQAYKMMEADGIGLSPSDFDFLVTRQIHPFQTAIQPYFTGTTNCRQGSSSSVCLNDISTKGSPYLTLSGKNKISWSFFDDGQFALKDGTLFLFENSNGGKRVWLFVDINGFQGKPNKAGVDLFVFQLTDDGLKAMGDEGTDYIGDTYCAATGWSGGAYNGMSCTNKAKNDPDYFKKVLKVIK